MPTQQLMKRMSSEDIQKIKFVQNISGAILRIPDLSEEGEEGRGVTLDVDEVLELASVVSEKAKLRSRDLRKGLQTYPASRSFDAVPAVLKVVNGFEDTGLVQTAITGTTISLSGSVQAAPGHFDIKLLEEQLKEVEYDLKSTKQVGQKAVLEMTRETLKKKIEEAKKVTKTGLASNVVVLNPDQAKSIL